MAQKRPVYNRGYDENKPLAVIARKGSWMIGGNVGFGAGAQDNYTFAVVSGITSNHHSLQVSPQFCWMFADNMGIGFRGRYSRSFLNVDNASAGFGDISLDVKNYSYLKHKYLGAVFFRYYRPLGPSGRFAAFADAEVAIGGSQTKVQDAHNENIRGSFDTGFSADIALNTGLMAFLTSHLAVNLCVGMLDFGYSRSNQIHNQIESGGNTKLNASFMVDLMALSFGISYYL
ncbi:MAG: hypothetical protein J5764_05455 [Bacteroidales bacterium]|nr:hypothetical protein [Bacteroidales bacterium]